MDNMVWGIEKHVQGTSGEPLDRKFERQSTLDDSGTATTRRRGRHL
jgi:hypothetical protein